MEVFGVKLRSDSHMNRTFTKENLNHGLIYLDRFALSYFNPLSVRNKSTVFCTHNESRVFIHFLRQVSWRVLAFL